MNWYFEVLKKYAQFSGRARRKEYWMFTLFNTIAFFVTGFLDGMIGTFDPSAGIGIISGLYCLAILLPSLAVSVRRLHDTGKSGWFILIGMIPIVGPIAFLVFMVSDSKGENQYGVSPKAVAA